MRNFEESLKNELEYPLFDIFIFLSIINPENAKFQKQKGVN